MKSINFNEIDDFYKQILTPMKDSIFDILLLIGNSKHKLYEVTFKVDNFENNETIKSIVDKLKAGDLLYEIRYNYSKKMIAIMFGDLKYFDDYYFIFLEKMKNDTFELLIQVLKYIKEGKIKSVKDLVDFADKERKHSGHLLKIMKTAHLITKIGRIRILFIQITPAGEEFLELVS